MLQRVREDYVDAIDDHKLMQAAIRGMVEALDSHSTLLSTDEFEDMQVSTSGAYAGIGVEVAPAKNGVSVVRRMAASPAEHAGILAGDVIVKIDGVSGEPNGCRWRDRAHARTRRQRDSSRSYSAPARNALLEFAIQRAHVQLQSVESELLRRGLWVPAHQQLHRYHRPELERAVAHLEQGGRRPLRGLHH